MVWCEQIWLQNWAVELQGYALESGGGGLSNLKKANSTTDFGFFVKMYSEVLN